MAKVLSSPFIYPVSCCAIILSVTYSLSAIITMSILIPIFFLFLALDNSAAAKVILANKVTQSLGSRDTSYGGWALSSPSCPSNSKTCTSSSGEGSCCPNGYDCQFDSVYDQHYCCVAGTRYTITPLLSPES